MSKIGRKPIAIKDTQVELKGQEVHYKGKYGAGVYILPDDFDVSLADALLMVTPKSNIDKRNLKAAWGLHRALLANKLRGVSERFEKKLKIQGLGYKASLVGNKMSLKLGFSHKIELDVPDGISVEIDKSGQNITVRSFDKELVGALCDAIRTSRPPEPYKGTGIRLANETIIRKAGKAKSTGE